MNDRSLNRLGAALALAFLCGCGAGGGEPIRSPTAAEDPARAEQARKADEELAKKNQEAEAAFMRGAATPEEP